MGGSRNEAERGIRTAEGAETVCNRDADWRPGHGVKRPTVKIPARVGLGLRYRAVSAKIDFRGRYPHFIAEDCAFVWS